MKTPLLTNIYKITTKVIQKYFNFEDIITKDGFRKKYGQDLEKIPDIWLKFRNSGYGTKIPESWSPCCNKSFNPDTDSKP